MDKLAKSQKLQSFENKNENVLQKDSNSNNLSKFMSLFSILSKTAHLTLSLFFFAALIVPK